MRWKVLELIQAYTDSEKKWRHKEILEKRKWTGEWGFDQQTEEANKEGDQKGTGTNRCPG